MGNFKLNYKNILNNIVFILVNIILLLYAFFCMLSFIPFTQINFVQFMIEPLLKNYFIFFAIFLIFLLFLYKITYTYKNYYFSLFYFCFSLLISSIAILINSKYIINHYYPAGILFLFFGIFIGFIKFKNKTNLINILPSHPNNFENNISLSILISCIFNIVIYYLFFKKSLILCSIFFISNLFLLFSLICTLLLFDYIIKYFFKYKFLYFILSLIFIFFVFALIAFFIIAKQITFFGFNGFFYFFTIGILLALFIINISFYFSKKITINHILEILVYPFIKISKNLYGKVTILLIIPILFISIIKTHQFIDWEFLILKTGFILFFIVSFSIFYALICRLKIKFNIFSSSLICLILILFLINIGISKAKKDASLTEKIQTSIQYSIPVKIINSFKILQKSDNSKIYNLLSKHTNISRNKKINLPDIKIKKDKKSLISYNPNIIIIVIDSLRQDYLSCYNPRVFFTPNINNFSKDAIVFKNAFTNYGATGLSEPSIWTGALIPHQQYPSEFYKINILEKFLIAENYFTLISKDDILRSILTDKIPHYYLDKNKGTQDYTLSETLNEIKNIVANQKIKQPFFIYTQSQDIHISRITKEGKTNIYNKDYKTFYAPYASRVERIDKFFGKFIQFLKNKNLYNNSIIILTSDHGDALGEGGRFGHAYTIFPEIIKIPIIMHLPDELKNKAEIATDKITFLIDLSNSILDALGYSILNKHQFFGNSIFKNNKISNKDYLICSSYGPNYGILNSSSYNFFISDAVNFDNYFYNIQINRKKTLDSDQLYKYNIELERLVKNLYKIYTIKNK